MDPDPELLAISGLADFGTQSNINKNIHFWFDLGLEKSRTCVKDVRDITEITAFKAIMDITDITLFYVIRVLIITDICDILASRPFLYTSHNTMMKAFIGMRYLVLYITG
jgi:hypothetical protein